MNHAGIVTIQPRFEEAASFYEGLARIQTKEQVGFVDRSGNLVIGGDFEDARDFSEGLAPVRKSGNWFYVDRFGNTVFRCECDVVGRFHSGLAYVRKGRKWVYIDPHGKLAINREFDDAQDFSEGLATVRIGPRWGVIDTKGAFRVEPRFEDAGAYSDGLARVVDHGVTMYIDARGRTAVRPPVGSKSHGNFHNGFASFEISGRYGFIDKSGRVIIKPSFEWVSWFSEGLAGVEVNGRRGYIDATGRVSIASKFDNVGEFVSGLAEVWIDDAMGYIDHSGRSIFGLKEYEGWELLDEVTIAGRAKQAYILTEYRTSFYQDGRATDVRGGSDGGAKTYVGHIAQTQFDRLAKLIVSEGFFQLRDQYTVPIDSEPVIIRVAARGRRKTVSSVDFYRPTKLWGIEAAIRQTAREIEWKIER